MRSAVVQLPGSRSAGEERQVLRAAIRQVERAEIYLAAVAAMELGDAQAVSAVRRLRTDVEGLRRHLANLRSEL